jgi:NAD(P)-dependent dehydrogenase (short-subunit alcohol dehydrogenase family)
MLAAALQGQGLQVVGITTDIASEDPPEPWPRAALDHFGSIEVLINNASLHERSTAPLLARNSCGRMGPGDGRQSARDVLSCRAVFPAMQERRRGKIVNISSSRVWEEDA